MHDTSVLTSEEAERSVIGAALLSSGALLDEVDLNPEDFASPRHEGLWRLMLEMRARGQATDMVTVAAALRTADDTLRRQVNAAGVAELATGVATASNAGYYAQIVRDNALRRRMQAVAAKISQAVLDVPAVEDLVDLARAEVEAAAKVNVHDVRPIGATIEETLEELDRPPRFVPSPWGDLNHLIGGFRPGALYVVGARPGSGKTIFGLQAALELAKHGAVAFSTLEMSEPELQKRMVSQLAHVGMHPLMQSDMSTYDRDRAWGHLDVYKKIPLFVDDKSDVTVAMVKSHARSVARHRPLAGVVVDYLQLLTPGRGVKSRARHEQVADMSRQLKKFAREMDVPVIALSQLNRASTNREDGKPTMADLRESGSIEQDADVIILLHRDDSRPDELSMHVAKNRHGMRQELMMEWHGSYSQILDKGL